MTSNLEFRRWTYGVGIGGSGMQIGDLDGNGTNEIVSGAGSGALSPNQYWYVTERNPDGSFAQTYVSELVPGDIHSLRLWDYNNDARPDIVVSAGNKIFIYDGPSKSLLTTVTTTASQVRSLCIADVEGTSDKELVFIDSSALYIYSRSGSQLAKVNGMGGADVAVGNVLADRTQEIIVAKNNGPAYVLHGRTRQIVETFPQGIGSYVRLVDTNGDSVDEIISAHNTFQVSCFRVGISRTPVWQINTGQGNAAIRIADIEADGIPDILLGQSNWGQIKAYDARNGVFKWAFTNEAHGVTDFAVGNLDPDPALEIVYGGGFTHAGADHLYVHDSQTRTKQWESLDLSGQFGWTALDYGDVDGDGNPDFLYASHKSNSGDSDGIWFVHDAVTKALKFTGPTTTATTFRGIWRIKMANVDADPQSEVFMSASEDHDGFVICYDGLTLQEQFRTSKQTGETMHGMVLADSDGDNQLDLVCTSYKEHSGALGVHIFVYNALTGALKWKSTSLNANSGHLSMLRVANVDSDPNPEIVVADRNHALTVYDGVTRFGQAVTGDLNISAMTTADLDGNGVQEIIICNQAGAITVRDPFTGNMTSTLALVGSEVFGLQAVDVAGTSAPDLVFVKSDIVNILYKDPTNTTITWHGGITAPFGGEHDALLVGDMDGDGKKEILIGDGAMGVRMYEISL